LQVAITATILRCGTGTRLPRFALRSWSVSGSPLEGRDCSTKQSGDLDLRNERLAREGAMGQAQGSDWRRTRRAARLPAASEMAVRSPTATSSGNSASWRQ